METVLITLKNGSIQTHENIWTTAISGNHLILISKQAETDVNNPDSDSYVFTKSVLLDLSEIQNYTVKTKTKKYDQK
jgi:hypothetical protein